MAQIFLSYAKQDKEKVENIHEKLSAAGFKPWMHSKNIHGGETRKFSVQRAI